jgi:hypothetical protein
VGRAKERNDEPIALSLCDALIFTRSLGLQTYPCSMGIAALDHSMVLRRKAPVELNLNLDLNLLSAAWCDSPVLDHQAAILYDFDARLGELLGNLVISNA